MALTIEERVARLEQGAQGILGTLEAHTSAIAAGAERLGSLEAFRGRVVAAWHALARGRRAAVNGESYEPPRRLTAAEESALAWLVEQRQRAEDARRRS